MCVSSSRTTVSDKAAQLPASRYYVNHFPKSISPPAHEEEFTELSTVRRRQLEGFALPRLPFALRVAHPLSAFSHHSSFITHHSPDSSFVDSLPLTHSPIPSHHSSFITHHCLSSSVFRPARCASSFRFLSSFIIHHSSLSFVLRQNACFQGRFLLEIKGHMRP